MLDVRGLRKVYEGSGRRTEAVRDLTFTVEAGELVCLVGPSGCGKTTLLKCVGGLLAPTAGEVFLAGRKVDGPPPGMAFVFQEYGRSLFPWMRVGQNVELPLKQKDLAKARRRELVELHARRRDEDAELTGRLARLTPREREVLGLIASGSSNIAIAKALHVTSRAVEKHINSIFTKLDLPVGDGTHRRVAAVLLYLGDSGSVPDGHGSNGTPGGRAGQGGHGSPVA